MEGVTVAKFITPKNFGRPLQVLPGVFITATPRGPDIRTQLTFQQPLEPYVRRLLEPPDPRNTAQLDSPP